MDNEKQLSIVNYQLPTANYPFKPAPIACLGDVPVHWDSSLLSYLFTENKEKNTGNIEDTILSLSYGKLIIKNSKENFGLLPASYETYQIINPGYIVFRFTDMQNDHVSLRVGHAQDRGIITSAYVGLKPRTELFSRYYYYLFHLLDILKFYYSFGGGVRQSLNYKGIRNLQLPLPPLAEQTAIANFLDRKTAQIDAYVALKEKTIALLQEQKTAIINRAVTQGLNPDVPMKDSGIEWLGKIPEDFNSIKLKKIASIIDGDRGKEYPNEGDFVDYGIPFLSSKNIVNGYLDFSSLRFITTDKFNKLGRGKLKKGDLIITVRGTIGNIGHFMGEEFETAFINAQMMILRPSHEITPRFLFYTALSNYWLLQVDSNSYGAAQQQLSNEILRNLTVAVPPIQIQESITGYLDLQTAKIDKAIAQAQRQIDLIKEYRESLISRAVTGKIRVVDNGELTMNN